MHSSVSFCNTYLLTKTYFLFSRKLKYFQDIAWQRKKLTEKCLQNSPDYWVSYLCTLENMTSSGSGEIIRTRCSKEARECGSFPTLLFETSIKAAFSHASAVVCSVHGLVSELLRVLPGPVRNQSSTPL